MNMKETPVYKAVCVCVCMLPAEGWCHWTECQADQQTR